jgi:hypothetical protein
VEITIEVTREADEAGLHQAAGAIVAEGVVGGIGTRFAITLHDT